MLPPALPLLPVVDGMNATDSDLVEFVLSWLLAWGWLVLHCFGFGLGFWIWDGFAVAGWLWIWLSCVEFV